MKLVDSVGRPLKHIDELFNPDESPEIKRILEDGRRDLESALAKNENDKYHKDPLNWGK